MEEGDYVACPEPPKPFVDIVEDGFGFLNKDDGTWEIVRRYTFTNQNNLTVQVITYGAAITSIKYPDKAGTIDDVVLGYDDLEGYLSPTNPYFGATIGRVANRIAKGHFKIGDEDYQLTTNIGEHHLHGGFKGFDKANWKSEIQGKKVVMTYLSKDGEEGYPGEVLACVLFELTTNNEFIIEMKASSSKPTPVNLTNHSYFNLAGHSKGVSGLGQHIISINADKYCHTDDDFIPSGMLKNVVNTLWDLRIGRKLGGILHQVPYGGYDQNMCIHKTSSECMSFIARAYHPGTGRTLEVYSNQPGVQFYTSNQFPVKVTTLPGEEIPVPNEAVELKGKQGVRYYKHQAFCLETQCYPDAVNHDPQFAWFMSWGCHDAYHTPGEDSRVIVHGSTSPYPWKEGVQDLNLKNFPNCILKPGENYYHIVKYKFDIYEEVIPEPDEEEIINDTESETFGEQTPELPVDEDDMLSTKLEENGR